MNYTTEFTKPLDESQRKDVIASYESIIRGEGTDHSKENAKQAWMREVTTHIRPSEPPSEIVQALWSHGPTHSLFMKENQESVVDGVGDTSES